MRHLVDGKPETELRRYLEHVRFPARKDQVVHAARQGGAPNELIQNLERVTVNEFGNADEVIEAYGTMD